MKSFKHYTGNKNISGLYQFIINRIPPHELYVELFAGSASIYFHITTPATTVLNDISRSVTDQLVCTNRHNFSKLNFPAVQLLLSFQSITKPLFVYCDPPYLKSTRYSNRKLYQFDMSDDDHKNFLSAIRTVNFNCLISHPSCSLYDHFLSAWNKESTAVRYHSKTVQETIYYNYPKPTLLQCYDYVGDDCWDRQRIKIKIDRLSFKLSNLPELERNAIINRCTPGLHTTPTLPPEEASLQKLIHKEKLTRKKKNPNLLYR